MIGPQIPVLLGVPDFSPYRLPGLEAAYDYTDALSGKIDASNRVSFWADKSGKSQVMGLVLPGTSGNYASAPDSAAVSVTGDIDIRVFCALNTWTPASSSVLLGKAGTLNFSYRFGIDTSGKLFFSKSQLGAAWLDTLSSVATGLGAFTSSWVRATYVSGTGVINFYTSTDGTTWNALGTPQSVSASAIFDGTTAVCVGAQDTSTAAPTTGTIYRAQIYNGIAGTLAFDANFTAQARGATSFAESSANAATVTINTSGDLGARICGSRDLAMLTGSKQPLYLPWSGANYFKLNGVSGDRSYLTIGGSSIGTGDFSAAMKFYVDPTAPGTSQNMLQIGSVNTGGTTGAQFFAYWSPSGNFLDLGFYGATNADYSLVRVANFLTNYTGQTVTVTATRSGTTLLVYINGVLQSTSTNSGGTPPGFGATVTSTYAVMGIQGTGTATMAIYAVRIYNAALNQAAVTADYNGTVQANNIVNCDYSVAANNVTSFNAPSGQTVTIVGTGAKPAQIVGKASLLFDGSAYCLKTAAFTLNQPTTIYLIVKQNTWASNRYLVDGNTGDTLTLRQVAGGVSPNIEIWAQGTTLGVTGPALGTNAIITAVFNANSSSVRVNRLSPALSVSSIGTQNAGGFTIGSYASGAAVFSAIQASAVLIFSAAHDQAIQDKVIQWLAAKGGIAA